MKHELIKLLVVLSTLSLNHVIAEERVSFKDGLDAYQKGEYLESLRIWETLAAANDPISAHSAGVLFANGLGVTQDQAKAFTLFLQSAQADYAPAQYDVGRSYFNGEGTEVNYIEAVKWWTKAADNKNVRALYNLATLYRKGIGVPRDKALAHKYYKMAADLGDSRAKAFLAGQSDLASTSASNDLGIKREPWILRQPSERYTVQASAFTSESSALSFVKDHDLDDDIAIFRANINGKIWYKAIYKSFKTRKDALQARDKLKLRFPRQSPWVRRFEDIHAEMITMNTAGLGEYSTMDSSWSVDIEQKFQQGQSAFNVQDYSEALESWKPLADNGVAEAQYGLGFMYESGWGVEQNYSEAFAWYEKAARLGHAKSQYNLGLLYLNGFGVNKDLDKARYWIEFAASQQDTRALELIEKGLVQGQ
ncbi:MAG: SPOR domain-containing protein [Arenicellales bacterium]|nr:SPOR domain-containing protein [Arenicellales bacterium]